ncbi:hypothetical protein HYPSUDRAFT_589170 [Hypholoma sublateritium FD-334 SS-4]|uniref:Uncharacterized protein n=1 Tax=Hypholoma sublateritium (strain FD-334 SS-4) TaxID=945553 RepID=A0A0D2L7R2_HYPSF|nr:hypothetical protein HYPSUDRAFT_589170 [Hypholoma sublateritium FD-334 SS-4]
MRSEDPHKYFHSMTPEQRAAVRYVHFFGRFYWINDKHLPVLGALGVRPTLMKITLLHSNLQWSQGRLNARGETGMILTMPQAGLSLQEMNGLQRLEVEVEAMSQYEAQLEQVSNALFKCTFNLPTGRMLSTKGNEVTRVRYMNIGLVPVVESYELFYSWRRKGVSGPAKVGFVVIRMIWTPKPRPGTPTGKAIRRNAKSSINV